MTVAEIKDYIAEQKLVIHSQKEDEVLLTESVVIMLDIIKDMLDQLDDDWVDVRDRLPSERGDYLTTIKSDLTGNVLVFIQGFDGEEWCLEIHEERYNTLAWRPLPQPYERKE